MNEHRFTIALTALFTLLFLSASAVTWAQTSADFGQAWHVVGSGGEHSASTSYRVTGTIGQSITGPSSSADFRVSSGYWVFAPPAQIQEYHLPFISR